MYERLLPRAVSALMACCVCCGLDEEGSGIRFLAWVEVFIVFLAPRPGCGVYQPPPRIAAMKEKIASYSALFVFKACCRGELHLYSYWKYTSWKSISCQFHAAKLAVEGAAPLAGYCTCSIPVYNLKPGPPALLSAFSI